MKNIIITLALLIGLASCNKYQNNANGPDDVRSLPSLHAVIVGEDFQFDSPSAYSPWDAYTDIQYESGNLKVGMSVGLDGSAMSAPVGVYKGLPFMIKLPSVIEGAYIYFTSTGQAFPIVWEMVP